MHSQPIMSEEKISIAIHGGAGTILKSHMTEALEAKYTEGLNFALEQGYDILEKGGNSLDAVEAAVIALENNSLFNAGKGSVFSATGGHEMDASIMQGHDLNAGAVSGVMGVKNPIKLAKEVMQNSEHVYLSGEGAMEFARNTDLEFVGAEYFYDEFRHTQWLEVKGTDKVQLDHTLSGDEKFGTVGAVALDINGNLAAATSTGGMTNKKFGRVGDSSIIGAGTYANNNTCAISCTGSGEFFIRGVVAYDVSCLMEYKGLTLQEACKVVIHERLPSIHGDGGLIGVDALGNLCMDFNTEGMYRAAKNAKGYKEVLIYGTA